jgi:hypothetical protein
MVHLHLNIYYKYIFWESLLQAENEMVCQDIPAYEELFLAVGSPPGVFHTIRTNGSYFCVKSSSFIDSNFLLS